MWLNFLFWLLAVVLSVVIVALLWKNGFKAMFANKKRD